MKNLIAISASALTAAAASAAVTPYTNQTAWTTAFTAQYTSPAANVYTDTLHNAAMSGANSVSGGHGWGAFSVASVLTTSQLSITNGGTANANIVSTPNPITNENFITFSWADASGPAGGIYAMGIIFSVTSNASSGSGAPFITATFAGGGNSNTQTTFATAGTTQFVGFIADNSQPIVTMQLGFSAGAILTVQDLVYGLVPAPGAMALLGVAGMVGTRRRRA